MEGAVSQPDIRFSVRDPLRRNWCIASEGCSCRGSDREFTMRFLAGAGDRNLYGNVHGSSMMKWMDEAAYACAAGWSGLPCVTVSFSGITFHKPVTLGHIVELRPRLVYTGPHEHAHCGPRLLARPPRGRVRTDNQLPHGVCRDRCGRPADSRYPSGCQATPEVRPCRRGRCG